MDLAKRPSIASQLSTIQMSPLPKLTDPPQLLPPPVRAFATTPSERKDALLGKPDNTEAPKRQTSLTKVKVEPIRMPVRLPSASSFSDLPRRGNQGNRPHPHISPLSLKKAHSNADVTSLPTLTKQVSHCKLSSPVLGVRKIRTPSQSRTRPPSVSTSPKSSESDPTSPTHPSSGSDGEVHV